MCETVEKVLEDKLWAAVHWSKDERKAACLQVIEQYEAGLIDLMIAAAQIGREEIIIGEEDIAQQVHPQRLILKYIFIGNSFFFETHAHANTDTRTF